MGCKHVPAVRRKGTERAAEWADAEQAVCGRKGREGHQQAEAGKGWKEGRAGSGARLKREKRRFFKIKFLYISSFQI